MAGDGIGAAHQVADEPLQVIDEATLVGCHRAGAALLQLGLELSVVDRRRSSTKDGSAPRRERLRLSLKSSHRGGAGQTLAEDDDEVPIDGRQRQVVVNLIGIGEEHYREGPLQSHTWTLELRHQRIEEARKARAEAELKERERIAALERARVDRLLAEAQALQRAREIRAYVGEVKALGANLTPLMLRDALIAWEQWAMAQADRIDPVLSRRFLDNDKLKCVG